MFVYSNSPTKPLAKNINICFLETAYQHEGTREKCKKTTQAAMIQWQRQWLMYKPHRKPWPKSKTATFLSRVPSHLFARTRSFHHPTFIRPGATVWFATCDLRIRIAGFTERIFIQTRPLWRVFNQPIEAFAIVLRVTRILKLIDDDKSVNTTERRFANSCHKATEVTKQ